MWDEAEKVLEGKIDILANNAGINPTVNLTSPDIELLTSLT
jgi:hypothetical protein